MLRYVTTRHYNIKLSVDKIIIIIEIIMIIIIKEIYKVTFHLYCMSVRCLYGVSAVFSRTVFEAMHLT